MTLSRAAGVVHTVHDPVGRPVEARYALVEHGGERTAVLEMSSASGFTLVSGADRDLLHASTFGTGELLARATFSNASLVFSAEAGVNSFCGRRYVRIEALRPE
jgi:glycerate kinase